MWDWDKSNLVIARVSACPAFLLITSSKLYPAFLLENHCQPHGVMVVDLALMSARRAGAESPAQSQALKARGGTHGGPSSASSTIISSSTLQREEKSRLHSLSAAQAL